MAMPRICPCAVGRRRTVSACAIAFHSLTTIAALRSVEARRCGGRQRDRRATETQPRRFAAFMDRCPAETDVAASPRTPRVRTSPWHLVSMTLTSFALCSFSHLTDRMIDHCPFQIRFKVGDSVSDAQPRGPALHFFRTGDQAAEPSFHGLRVRFRCPLPSAFMT